MEWSCNTGEGWICLFLSLVLQDYRIPVCAQLLVMIVIAGSLLLLGFVFKPVSSLAGDSRLRQTFSLRIHLVERQSLSPICPSTIIPCFRSLEASLRSSVSRSTAGPIVFSLNRNKPVTIPNTSLTKASCRWSQNNICKFDRSNFQVGHFVRLMLRILSIMWTSFSFSWWKKDCELWLERCARTREIRSSLVHMSIVGRWYSESNSVPTIWKYSE